MEALDKEENPIPGLYAVGIDTGGWETDTYNVELAGATLGFSVMTRSREPPAVAFESRVRAFFFFFVSGIVPIL